MFYRILVLLTLFFISQTKLFSQNEKGEFRKDLFINNYTLLITNNEVDYFTGSITVTDRITNLEVFKADSFFTEFISDTLIDLDKNGAEELVLTLSTGMTIYDYSMILIFDIYNIANPVQIQNAELLCNVDSIPKITSNVRLSPSFLSAGYTYSFKYDNGKLIADTNISKSKVLKLLAEKQNESISLITEYKSSEKNCENDNEYLVYFEAFITQQKIFGMESTGWEIFNKYYKCKNKKTAKKIIQKAVNENYNSILNFNNYLFKSN